MQINSIAGTLKGLTEILNRPTDLKELKKVNRQRRDATKTARDAIRNEAFQKTAVDSSFLTDKIPFQVNNLVFRHGSDPKWSLKNGSSLSVPPGKIVAIAGQHGSGRNTFLRLLAHELFPTEGSIFIPTHLRVLHVSREPYLLASSIGDNLHFGCSDWDHDRVLRILDRLKMDETRELMERAPGGDGGANVAVQDDDDDEEEAELPAGCSSCCSEAPIVAGEVRNLRWQEHIPYTEKAKIHLARAFIMNPEVMVLQRPLSHFNPHDQQIICKLLREHVTNRGLELPEAPEGMRRPRTVFFSSETKEQAEQADIVWQVSRQGHTTTIELARGTQIRHTATMEISTDEPQGGR